MIAEAATRHNTGKELVLTHTHAGVSALKQKVEKFSKSKNNVQIETIASWVLRYAKSFPKSSNFHKQLPENNHEWNQVYLSVAELLKNSSIKEIVKSSYTGVYVDEYQDCTVQQHETIMNLSEIIPCRILGDPIQSIFGFGANTVVNWDKDVAPFFTCLPELTVPWRWKDCAPELGEWLTYIRKQLIDRNTIDLSLAPKSCVRWVELPDKNSPIPVQIKTCFDTMKYLTGNIAAIYGPTDVNPCNFLARRTGGKYSVVEVIDCSDLFESACKIMNSSGLNRLLCIINFAKSCMSGLSGDFENVVSAFQKGKISTSKKY
ncbi:MAG: UvrD-helicase domain-containing protein, partial [Syntrophales bacterium]